MFFIQLDTALFKPSMTESILDTAISFARQHTVISDENLTIVKHCRESL